MGFSSLRHGLAISLALACAGGTAARADLTVHMAATDVKTGVVDARTAYFAKGRARFDWSHYVGIVDFTKGVVMVMDMTAKSYAKITLADLKKGNGSSPAISGAKTGLAFKTVKTCDKLTINKRQAQKVVLSVNGKPLIEAWLSSSLKPDEVVDFCATAPYSLNGLISPEVLELLRQSKEMGLAVRVNNMLDNVKLELQDASSSAIAPAVFSAPTGYSLVKPKDMLTPLLGDKP
jgi:hypothetical protein